MNVLGFVFAILTLLTFSAVLAMEKQASAHRLRSSYTGHITANRTILNQAASEFYNSLKQNARSRERQEKEPPENSEIQIPPPPPINPHCARLNLFPLIEHGPKEEPYLYETTAKMLKIFYGEDLFEKKTRAEYKFLDAFLKAVRAQMGKEEFTVLEKVSFKDPRLQSLYYTMLKGTKKADLVKGIGYPSVLDYIKVEPGSSKICLFHAHPNLLSVFFTTNGATKLYASIHTPKAPPATQESIERICEEVHARLLDGEAFDLFELVRRRHGESPKATLVGEDPETKIFLRKVISLRRSSEIAE